MVNSTSRIALKDVTISDCQSGGKGSAIYIRNFNDVVFENLVMYANGPSSAKTIEDLYSVIFKRYN